MILREMLLRLGVIITDVNFIVGDYHRRCRDCERGVTAIVRDYHRRYCDYES